MTAPKSKTTAARLCECIRAAQEAGQTVASARVEGPCYRAGIRNAGDRQGGQPGRPDRPVKG